MLSEKTIQQAEVVQKLELELVQAKEDWQDAVGKKEFAMSNETHMFNIVGEIEANLYTERVKLFECMREIKRGSK